MYDSVGMAPVRRIAQPSLGQTVGAMRQFAYQGAADMQIGRLVERICSTIQPGDYASEVLACYYWVCQNIRYMRDPLDVELLKWPIRVVESGNGDCDDIATLLAAMMMRCGNRCSFVVASLDPSRRPSHVFVVVHTPQNGTVVLDPVANAVTSQMLRRMTKATTVPV